MEKLLEEIRSKIEDKILVSHQLVVFAKDFIVKNTDKDPSQLINDFMESQDCKKIDLITVKDVADQEDIKSLAKYISCAYACEIAFWDLINCGILLPQQGFQTWAVINPKVIRYITESNTETKLLGAEFSKFTYPVKIKASYLLKDKGFITDFDLFLSNLTISNAEPEVKEAIEDCINCFKKDLYRPAATMLGKAVEGAWIELAISMGNYFTIDERGLELVNLSKSENTNFPKIVRKTLGLYTNESFKEIRDASFVKPTKLEEIASVFTDVVRDARHAIHFQYKPAIANSYEKMAILLLNFAQNIQPLYKIKALLDRKIQDKSY